MDDDKEGVLIVFPLPDVCMITKQRDYDHKKKKTAKKPDGEIKDLKTIKDIIQNFNAKDNE